MTMSNTASMAAIAPILIVIATGMLVLIGDSCIALWRDNRWVSPTVAIIGASVAFVSAGTMIGAGGVRTAFNGAITADAFSQACNIILIVIAVLAILLASTYLENRDIHHGEYYSLVLFSTSGAMLMAAASELIVLFVAIEILSVALYVLAGFARTEARSEEAALKYFLLGAFAAGFLLYGIALIYGGSANSVPGQVGTTNLAALGHYLVGNGGPNDPGPSLMLIAGIALLLVGLAFKAALIPFHMWTPDVYEGAPTSVTAYMAAAAKVGAFAAIVRVFNALIPITAHWILIVQALAVVTMFGGNIIAVTQDNVKRMLAYSSIAHAGYLMVAVSALSGWGAALDADRAAAHSSAMSGITFYLLAYSVMTMGAFGVLILLSRKGHDVQTLNDLKGLVRKDPPAAYVMLIFMLSLGGIPPTMGFMGKWIIFYATLQAGQAWLAIALAVASIISIYYYLRVVWMMCFTDPESARPLPPARSAAGVWIVLSASLAATVLFGLAPGLARSLMDAAATVLRP
jgi:NADH-quinone oxidoreductase subunit N